MVGKRDVYFKGDWTKTGIYDRTKLKLGAEVLGPAIIEEVNSTTVIPPDTSAVVDSYGNIIITV